MPRSQPVQCWCREMLQQQLFLLNTNLNNAILRSREECVQVWGLQLIGVQLGKLYSLQDLQTSYKAAAKVSRHIAPAKAGISLMSMPAASLAALSLDAVTTTMQLCHSNVIVQMNSHEL